MTLGWISYFWYRPGLNGMRFAWLLFWQKNSSADGCLHLFLQAESIAAIWFCQFKPVLEHGYQKWCWHSNPSTQFTLHQAGKTLWIWLFHIHCAVRCGSWGRSGSVETVTQQLETKVVDKNNILMPLISKLKNQCLQIGHHLSENIWLWLAIE